MGIILDYVIKRLADWTGANEADLNELKHGESWLYKFHNYNDAKAYLMSLRYKYYDPQHNYASWEKMHVIQMALERAKTYFNQRNDDTISNGDFDV